MGDRSLRLALLGWSLLATHAQASAPVRLKLEVSACPGGTPNAAELARSVRAELEADALVQLADRNNDAVLVAEIGCDEALSTSLRLSSGRTQLASERRIVLGDAKPSARAGVLALAAAELVRSEMPRLAVGEARNEGRPDSRADYPSEPGAAPAEATESPDRPASAALAAPKSAASKPDVRRHDPLATAPNPARDSAPDQRRRAWAVAADVRMRWFVDYASMSWGGAAGTDVGPWRLRAEALLSSPHDSLGSATLGSAAGCVGYRLLEQPLGALQIALYPQLAAGATWMRGSTEQSDVRVAPATGFYADARLVTQASFRRATLSPVLSLELGRATGYVARSAGRAVGATGGFFVGASAGASY